MTDNNKPEWFEITEKDQPTFPRKASKTLPIAAVLAATLIIGVGAVVAKVQEHSPAIAVDTTAVRSASITNSASPTSVAQNSQSSTATQIASPSASTAVVVPVTPVAKKEATVAVATKSPGLQNPAISKLPTKGGDDEDDEDDEDGHSQKRNHDDDDKGDND